MWKFRSAEFSPFRWDSEGIYCVRLNMKYIYFLREKGYFLRIGPWTMIIEKKNNFKSFQTLKIRLFFSNQ